MHTLRVEPLTCEAFAPFGAVLQLPQSPGRVYYNDALANLRAHAGPSLSLARYAPSAGLPMQIHQMERHPYSSQTFIPIQVARYLVLVAPHGASGRPDMAQARAFLVHGQQGVTYFADTWHHGMTVFDDAATFAICMWQAGDAGDETFADIDPVLLQE
ncbi:hypothetical protein AAV94_11735 [Lampropedia cohaerens]|uniref:Ureidoglycolate hydrolase n=1 Tax=Lampropedia cohaerens TaxID=1610491 RepID=A0A0U1PXK2_9BURK|nr:ureidoglycolate lyase [Lampropedia cohaerens]KKW67187.1 hypothetical protein AAV94_11735 [Lampropedia cohaerens]